MTIHYNSYEEMQKDLKSPEKPFVKFVQKFGDKFEEGNFEEAERLYTGNEFSLDNQLGTFDKILSVRAIIEAHRLHRNAEVKNYEEQVQQLHRKLERLIIKKYEFVTEKEKLIDGLTEQIKRIRFKMDDKSDKE